MFTNQVNTAISRTAMFAIFATQVHGASSPKSFLKSTLATTCGKYSWKPLCDGRYKWSDQPSEEQKADFGIPDSEGESLGSLFKKLPKNMKTEIGSFLVPEPPKVNLKRYTELYKEWQTDGGIDKLCDLMQYGERYERGALKEGYCRVLVQVRREEKHNGKKVITWYAEWKLGSCQIVNDEEDQPSRVDVCWYDRLPWAPEEEFQHPDPKYRKRPLSLYPTRQYPFDSWFIHYYKYDPKTMKHVVDSAAKGELDAATTRRIQRRMKKHPIHSPIMAKSVGNGEIVGDATYDFPDKNVMEDFHTWLKERKWPEHMTPWQKFFFRIMIVPCCPCVVALGCMVLCD